MNKNKLIKPDDPEFEYAAQMRAVCPVPGDTWVKFMTVHLDAGEGVAQHDHTQHTIVYYPEEVGPVIITPKPGTIICMAPGTLHEVPVVKKPRLSIVMLVE